MDFIYILASSDTLIAVLHEAKLDKLEGHHRAASEGKGAILDEMIRCFR